MENLAGNKDCDQFIRTELSQAGVEIVDVGPSRREVPYTLEGKIGPYRLWRAWYYWIVEGLVPMDVAKEMQSSHGNVVRTAGMSGGCDPEWWTKSSREEYENYLPYFEKKEVPPDLEDLTEGKSRGEILEKFLGVMKYLARRAYFIDHYHIDTQEGLDFFVETIKKHGLDKEEDLLSKGGYRGAFGKVFGSLQDGAPENQRRHEGSW